MGRHVCAFIAVVFGICSTSFAQYNLPPGFFATELISSGLTEPTCMVVAPDGTVYIAEKSGSVRVWRENTGLSPLPFFGDTPLTVYSVGEAGLIGLELDPDFSTNHYIYAHYIRSTSPRRARISRFTVNGDGDQVIAGSEAILLDLSSLTGAGHYGGAMHFGPDSMLYVGVGDNSQSNNSQSINNLSGKLLRIRPIPGNAVPDDNPGSFPGITGSTVGDNRAIWAVGLRNPFTFAFQNSTGRLIINDVGGNKEELNEGMAGRNYGWPATEYGNPPYGPEYTPALYSYSPSGTGSCVAGGVFLESTNFHFPSEYSGNYFFGDYWNRWISRLDPTTGVVKFFAWPIGRVVDLDIDHEGRLLILGYGTVGKIFRVDYSVPLISCSAQQQLELQVNGAQGWNFFGYTIAGSGNTAVIGAPLSTAYVFNRDGASWIPQATLTTSDTPGGIGTAIAIHQDTILIGKESDSQAGGVNAGSAYVFRRSETNWLQEAKLLPLIAGSQFRFGHAVALGTNVALVGSPGASNGIGAVHVFNRAGSNWSEQIQLMPSDSPAGAKFGSSLAVSGDSMLVAAPNSVQTGPVQAGAAYIFVRQGLVWFQQAKLLPANSPSGETFARAVAISGDTAVVGADGSGNGAVYVFVRTNGLWQQQARLQVAEVMPGEGFGTSVATDGHTIIAGAPNKQEAGGLQCGAAYVFTSNGISWTQRAKTVPNEGSAFDQFGTGLWLSGATALIGAPHGSQFGPISPGSAYEFDLSQFVDAGDLNGDGVVSMSDLDLFVQVLLGTDTNGEHIARGDVNCSGTVDGRDVQGILDLLMP